MDDKTTTATSMELNKVSHKIGSTRSIQTAVLVVAYLETAYPWFNRGLIHYHFNNDAEWASNGGWAADIIVDTYGPYDRKVDEEISDMVRECRAFVAGRGEIWA